MKKRVNTIACALLIGVLAVPAAQASGQRPPVKRHRAAVLHQTNVFANLGHEGSGRRTVDVAVNAFANLGHEGSGLAAAYEAAKLRPWAA